MDAESEAAAVLYPASIEAPCGGYVSSHSLCFGYATSISTAADTKRSAAGHAWYVHPIIVITI